MTVHNSGKKYDDLQKMCCILLFFKEKTEIFLEVMNFLKQNTICL